MFKEVGCGGQSLMRIGITAFAYSQDVEYDAEFVAKLKASTRSCSIDCPLVNGAYGRVLLNVFLDGNQPETLQQAVHYLTKGLPEELPETRLKLAVAYALQGNFDQARALQASLDRVSFPGVKKALDYYLSMRSTGTNKVPPRLKYRNKVAEYLIKNATAGPIARPAVD